MKKILIIGAILLAICISISAVSADDTGALTSAVPKVATPKEEHFL